MFFQEVMFAHSAQYGNKLKIGLMENRKRESPRIKYAAHPWKRGSNDIPVQVCLD